MGGCSCQLVEPGAPEAGRTEESSSEEKHLRGCSHSEHSIQELAGWNCVHEEDTLHWNITDKDTASY